MTTESIVFIEAGLTDLSDIRQFIEVKSTEMGCSDDISSEFVLAVNEAVTNIIVHGYGIKPGFVSVSIEQEGANIIISVRDEAGSFDPNSISSPDTTLPLEMRQPGGMGIHMMRNFVDEMKYHRTEDRVNVLTMVMRDAIGPVE